MRGLVILLLGLYGGICLGYAVEPLSLILVTGLIGLLGWVVFRIRRSAMGLLLVMILFGLGRVWWYHSLSLNNKYYVNCEFDRRLGITDQYRWQGRLIQVRAYAEWDTRDRTAGLVQGQLANLTGSFRRTPGSLDGVLYQGDFVRLVIPVQAPGWRETLSRWKLELARVMKETLGQPEGTLAASLVLGTREDALKEKSSLLKYLGIIHILSISGFHVNLLEMILERSPLRRLSLLLILLYAVFIGSIPAWRAALMKASRAAGRVCHRDSDALNQLLTAAFLLAAVHPPSLFSASYQLTFAATLGLIVLQPELTRALVWLRGGKWKDGLILSLAAMIPCIPTLAAMSFDVNLALFPANLILVPLYSFYCFGAFAAVPLAAAGLKLPLALLGAALGALLRVLEILEYALAEFLSLRVGWSGAMTPIWLWLCHGWMKNRAVTPGRRCLVLCLVVVSLHWQSILPGTTRVIFHQQMGQARIVVQTGLRQFEFVSRAMYRSGVRGRVILVEEPIACGDLILIPDAGAFPRLMLAGAALRPAQADSSDIINEEYLWIFSRWIRLK